MRSSGKIIQFEKFKNQLGAGSENSSGPGNPLVFLQCPIGPVTAHLLDAAKDAGFTPMKINFNAGDYIFAQSEYSVNYQGRIEDWDSWFVSLLELVKPVGIVLMGDMRGIHQVAIAKAKQHNVPVLCLEEGYMRPNFVTVELGGVNANSPLRASFQNAKAANAPIEAVKEPEQAKPSQVKPIGNDMFWTVCYVCQYYAAKTLGSLRFRHYEHHRERPIFSEVILWMRGYLLKFLRAGHNKSRILKLVEHLDCKYFVVALQVADDMQLRWHGRNWSNQLLINETIKAFAACAPPNCHLVIKGHPLDRGRYNYRDLVRKVSALAGCPDRVIHLDDGSISLLIRHSLGLITINSTSGISALHHRKPLLALGEALYSVDGLVNPAEGEDCIKRFITNPQKPDAKITDEFLTFVQKQALVNGSYYQKRTLQFSARNIIERIQQILAAQKRPAINFSATEHGEGEIRKSN